jgi:hypothetical protein
MEKLDDLRKTKVEIEAKIEAEKTRHLEAFAKLKERLEAIDRAIFELDEGRTLEAAKRAQAANPEFAALLLAMRQQIELEEVAKAVEKVKKTGKRGRPTKSTVEIPPNPAPIKAPAKTK